MISDCGLAMDAGAAAIMEKAFEGNDCKEPTLKFMIQTVIKEAYRKGFQAGFAYEKSIADEQISGVREEQPSTGDYINNTA